MQRRARLSIDGVARVVVVNKTTHSESLIVDDSVTVADADPFVGNAQRIHGICEDTSVSGLSTESVVLVRPLERSPIPTAGGFVP